MNRIIWLLFRRFYIMRKYKNTWAHWTSYIDKKTQLYGYNKIHNYSTIRNSVIGKYTYVSTNTHINNCNIENFCSIGPNCNINSLARHPTHSLSTHPMFYSNGNECGVTINKQANYNHFLTSKIGNDVWIGANTIVLNGSQIENGAIIGAGSIVTKNIPPYAIAVGSPAKIVKYRFPQDIVEEIQNSKWWELDAEDLKLVLKNFLDQDYLSINIKDLIESISGHY